ncbi:alpha/beta hydrolase [Streptomyces sp. NPDC046805]|uniref:alpha/beta hydrolase n=1 Tax=Streptomyces sp. NPDC046805 TaxID=3155134 RepID=UPI0033C797FC
MACVASVERVIILHGYMASPTSHRFEWLHDELTREGVEVEISALPNSTAPEPEVWITAAAKVPGEPNGRTAVVGHSLVCATALHALDRLDGTWKLPGRCTQTFLPRLGQPTGFDELPRRRGLPSGAAASAGPSPYKRPEWPP